MYANRILILFGIILSSLISKGVIAQVSVSPEPVMITQPNQSKITIVGVGTPAKPYTETMDGYTLLKNKRGIYVYAKLDNNQRLTPSKLKAHNPENRSKKETKCLNKHYIPHLR